MSESTGMTGTMANVAKIQQNFERLQSDNVELKVQVAELTQELEAANGRADEANARATKLAAAVDRSVDVEREPGEHFPLDVVTYRFVDVITGDELSGPAVVVRPGEGALVVAPISPLHLTLPADAVQAIRHEDEDEDA